MSVQHFKSLLFKSARIQEEIEREQNRRWPDWMRLLKLKKIRLAIKDRMTRILYQNSYGYDIGTLRPVKVTTTRPRAVRR